MFTIKFINFISTKQLNLMSIKTKMLLISMEALVFLNLFCYF